jgi:hypothetical protein
MNCPKCSSENVQKLSVIYQSGTHKINTSSTTVGGGYMSGPGIGMGSTTTTGKQQSIMAKMAAPPPKRSYAPSLMAILGFLMVVVNLDNGGTYGFLGLAIIAASIVWVYFAYQYNTGEWKQKQSIWQASWHCNKCGEMYQF